MSWIRTVPPEDAEGALAGVYEAARAASRRGAVSNLWQALGLDPSGAAATHTLYRALMADPAPLTRVQAEMIALVVSATNGCGYCVAHHGPRLAAALGDETLARAVALDYREANLAARDRVLLDYAVALTCEPSERKSEDVERLREYGFEDGAILRATEIAALYALTNRLASGLGVPLEPGVAAWEFGAQR
uniref:Peroxidase n=1 Tax=Eiseniibacteriota bacterium TaxID=2212470 RepID=A0A832I0A7_UNCEI